MFEFGITPYAALRKFELSLETLTKVAVTAEAVAIAAGTAIPAAQGRLGDQSRSLAIMGPPSDIASAASGTPEAPNVAAGEYRPPPSRAK